MCSDGGRYPERPPGGTDPPMSDSPIADPIIMLFEQIIGDESVILFVYFSRFDQLVRLLPVAAPVRELQVA